MPLLSNIGILQKRIRQNAPQPIWQKKEKKESARPKIENGGESEHKTVKSRCVIKVASSWNTRQNQSSGASNADVAGPGSEEKTGVRAEWRGGGEEA